MDTKQEVIRLAKQYNLTAYRVAYFADSDRAVAYFWLDEKHHLKPTRRQIAKIKNKVGEYMPEADWRKKRGIEAVIANMYALEVML